jgi:CheY-like chemotaxis protein
MIRRQARHLARLLDDLLDVARITSGRIQMERDLVDLRAVVDLAVESQRHQLEGKRQTIGVDEQGHAISVLGDPVRLQQVLGNLVNNASKYSRPEGSIRVILDVEGPEAVLRVIDDGVGIPEGKLDSIFELFAQANPGLARTEGGLGIGLTLVKRIVELHGGTVCARSGGLGRGAEFTVRLPVVSHTRPVKPTPAARPRTTARRILVVEDHADGRESLATSLALHGHQVVAAATGHEGVEAAVSFVPDVVLLDIGLPDIDGYEVAKRLRAEPWGRDVVLIAATGWGQERDRRRSAEAGFDAHLVKPVEPAKLLQVLESLIEAPVG